MEEYVIIFMIKLSLIFIQKLILKKKETIFKPYFLSYKFMKNVLVELNKNNIDKNIIKKQKNLGIKKYLKRGCKKLSIVNMNTKINNKKIKFRNSKDILIFKIQMMILKISNKRLTKILKTITQKIVFLLIYYKI